MAVSTESVKQKLAQRAAQDNAVKPAPAKDPLQALIDSLLPAIQQAVPKTLRPDRLARILLTTLRTNPKLLDADRTSLKAAILLTAQLGLEPGPLGQVYLVPFVNRKSGKTEVQVIIGYRGMLDLARRSGQIQSVMVEPVCEGDEFDFELGLQPRLYHKPNLERRGKPYLYYGIVRFKDGGYQMAVMTIQEIEEHRKRSRAANEGPWVTDYDVMARKTVLRSMWRWLPMSVEMALAEAADEAIVHDAPERRIINITPGHAADEGQAEVLDLGARPEGDAGNDGREEPAGVEPTSAGDAQLPLPA